MKYLLSIIVLVFVAYPVNRVDGGLLIGPRVVNNHYYSGVPLSASARVYTSVAPVYATAPPIYGVISISGKTHPHKAAHHAKKAAKHQALADHYLNN